MRPTGDTTMDREQRLDAVITGNLQAVAAGRPPDETEWPVRHADLTHELRAFLAGRTCFAGKWIALRMRAHTRCARWHLSCYINSSR